MTELKLNREFAFRHLAVTVLMLGLSGWFGYDGFVNYPRQDESYFEVRHLHRDSAIRRQKEFMMITFLAALAIGGHLLAVARFRFAFDDEGFVYKGVRRAYSEVCTVDRSKWERKGIVVVDGVKLDAWHHVGVKEFVERLKS